jgi:hypothetical protein
MVYGLGFRGWGSGVQGFRGQGFRGSGFRVQGSGVQGAGVQGSGFRSSGVLVQGLGSTLGLSTALELVSACDRDFLNADVCLGNTETFTSDGSRADAP